MHIRIVDDLPPETVAMAQAFYSRKPESVEVILPQATEDKAGKFMEQYYIGYSHASVGDGGTTTLFIEGVSMLAAKAIQDSRLYKGTEASTRYMDMSVRECFNPFDEEEFDPLGTGDGGDLQQRWMNFYKTNFNEVVEHLRSKHPLQANENKTTWSKAVDARAFDILRAFIPAGLSTQLSWSTDLRHAREHIDELLFHPLPEVQLIAEKLLGELREKYPSSFGYEMSEAHATYRQWFSEEINYNSGISVVSGDEVHYTSTVNNHQCRHEYHDMMEERPKYMPLPRVMDKLGTYTCQFLLDFGSYRDIQRHRNGVCQQPRLTCEFGFSNWYLDQLPDSVREKADVLIIESEKLFNEYENIDANLAQYYIPMGYRVPVEVTYTLPQMVYVSELRSGETVHPTLRVVAQDMAKRIASDFPELKIYANLDKDPWSIRRGTQDITKK